MIGYYLASRIRRFLVERFISHRWAFSSYFCFALYNSSGSYSICQFRNNEVNEFQLCAIFFLPHYSFFQFRSSLLATVLRFDTRHHIVYNPEKRPFNVLQIVNLWCVWWWCRWRRRQRWRSRIWIKSRIQKTISSSIALQSMAWRR